MRARLIGDERVLVALTVAILACGPGTESHEDFERMRMQQRYAPYRASSFFRDGLAMRTLPAGTVAREDLLGGDSLRPASFANAMQAAIADQQLMRTGAEDFHVYCATCHGEQASAPSVVAANLEVKPPPLLGGAARSLSDSAVFAIITMGRGTMPAYGWAIPARERLGVIAYLRTLQAPGGGQR